MSKRQRTRHARAVALTVDSDTGPSIRFAAIVDAVGIVIREPTAERSSWNDPLDLNPNRRMAKQVNGARAANPVLIMRRKDGLITERHVRAAELFACDYEMSCGGGLGALKLESSHGSTGGDPTERELAAVGRVRRAWAVVGDERSRRVVGWCVLGMPTGASRGVAGWAELVGLAPAVAMGYFWPAQ